MPKKKEVALDDDDDMLPDYDFSNGVRGAFAPTFPNGSRVVVLDPDVAKIFTSQEAANKALRGLAETMKMVKG